MPLPRSFLTTPHQDLDLELVQGESLRALATARSSSVSAEEAP